MSKIKPYILQAIKRLTGNPIKEGHSELSVIHSQEKKNYDKKLLSLTLQSIKNASNTELKFNPKNNNYVHIWPGEHYKLLAGLIKTLKPKIAIEIGTHIGLGALALKEKIGKGKVITFDIVKWDAFETTVLTKKDLDNHLIQYADNLADYKTCLKHKDILKKADLIFIDASKDGKFEYLLMENFEKIGLKKDCILVFDDIKVWNMLKFWNELKKPKLDVTSFGHWSGTGLVRWS